MSYTHIAFGPSSQTVVHMDGFRVVYFMAAAHPNFVMADEEHIYIALAYRPHCIVEERTGTLWIYGAESTMLLDEGARIIWPTSEAAPVADMAENAKEAESCTTTL